MCASSKFSQDQHKTEIPQRYRNTLKPIRCVAKQTCHSVMDNKVFWILNHYPATSIQTYQNIFGVKPSLIYATGAFAKGFNMTMTSLITVISKISADLIQPIESAESSVSTRSIVCCGLKHKPVYESELEKARFSFFTHQTAAALILDPKK